MIYVDTVFLIVRCRGKLEAKDVVGHEITQIFLGDVLLRNGEERTRIDVVVVDRFVEVVCNVIRAEVVLAVLKVDESDVLSRILEYQHVVCEEVVVPKDNRSLVGVVWKV